MTELGRRAPPSVGTAGRGVALKAVPLRTGNTYQSTFGRSCQQRDALLLIRLKITLSRLLPIVITPGRSAGQAGSVAVGRRAFLGKTLATQLTKGPAQLRKGTACPRITVRLNRRFSTDELLTA